MRYSAMYGNMSRIEAAKRALWGIVLLNRKFFPMDSIYLVGFGALASKIHPNDIPYLKTFEPGAGLLHYTNYYFQTTALIFLHTGERCYRFRKSQFVYES